MKNSKYIIALLLLLAINLHAQEKLTRTISVQEAITLAVKNSKSIELSKYKIDMAEDKRDMAVNAFLPNLSVNAGYTRISDNITPFKIVIPGVVSTTLNPVIPNQFNNRVSLQQNIFSGLRNVYNLQASKDMIIASQLDSKKEEEDLILNIIQQYYTYCKTTQSKQLIAENIKSLDARIHDLENFKSVGMALQNDVLKAQLAKSNLEISQAEVDNSSAIITYNLSLLLGFDASSKFEPSPVDFTSLSEQNTSAFAPTFENRLDWKSMNFKILAGQKQVKSARSTYYPSVNAGFNYYYNNPNQREFPQRAAFKGTWDVGVSLNWNISSLYTSRASVRDAKINSKINAMVLEQMEDGIQSEQYSYLKNYELSLQKITIAQKALEQATENQRIMKNRYDSSVAIFSDLLEADTQLLQSKINLINLQYDAKIAYYKYVKAIGSISTSIIN